MSLTKYHLASCCKLRLYQKRALLREKNNRFVFKVQKKHKKSKLKVQWKLCLTSKLIQFQVLNVKGKQKDLVVHWPKI